MVPGHREHRLPASMAMVCAVFYLDGSSNTRMATNTTNIYEKQQETPSKQILFSSSSKQYSTITLKSVVRWSMAYAVVVCKMLHVVKDGFHIVLYIAACMMHHSSMCSEKFAQRSWWCRCYYYRWGRIGGQLMSFAWHADFSLSLHFELCVSVCETLPLLSVWHAYSRVHKHLLYFYVTLSATMSFHFTIYCIA